MKAFYNISDPTFDLIDLPTAKRQLNSDTLITYEDTLIDEIRIEAVSLAEDYLNRYLTERIIVIECDQFFSEIEQNIRPIVEITSVEYKDANNADQTLNPLLYSLEYLNRYDNELYFADFDNLPAVYDDAKAIKITAKVGYPAGECPGTLTAAVKLLISKLFINRDDSPAEKRSLSKEIMRPFKTWG